MVNVRVKAPFEVELEGDITDVSDLEERFAELAVSPGALLRIGCAGVHYINSVGVKRWIMLFEGFRNEGVRLIFWGCSPPVVSTCNLLANFVHRDEIESLQLPFACPKCLHEQLIQYTVAELKPDSASAAVIPEPLCERCSTRLEFDESQSEYLNFLG